MNTYLIDEVIALQINKMRSLFIVGQMRPDSLRHRHDEAAVIHIQPITTPNKFIVGVSSERAVGLRTKVRFVKAGMK